MGIPLIPVPMIHLKLVIMLEVQPAVGATPFLSFEQRGYS